MSAWNLLYEILYPGETLYKDITSIATSRNLSISRYMCGSSHKSAISTASITLLRGTTEAKVNLQQSVFSMLMDAKANGDLVHFRLYDRTLGSYIFRGIVDTSNLSLAAGVKIDELTLEVENYLKLLDDDIETEIEFPDIDLYDSEGNLNEGAYVFNPSDPANSLIVKLLMLRGFGPSDIDFANSVQILDRIPRFVYSPDKAKSYRNRIDTILYEYNAVLDQTDSGKFIIRSLKHDNPVASRTVAYSLSNKMKLSGGNNLNDGVKVVWSELDVRIGATIYQASVTPTYDGSGVVVDEGEEVQPLGYWPETGDIEEIYYDFKADFLDREYYTKLSRLKNEDLSLITVRNAEYELMADPQIQEVTALREIHPLKARVVLYNSDATQKRYIRLFNMIGTALYRKKNNYTTYPETARKPEEYESEFIYSKDASDAFGSNRKLLMTYGDNKYSWTEFGSRVQVGEIVNARVKNSVVSALVLITSVKWSKVNPNTWRNDVSAIGISAYNALSSKNTSVLTGRGTQDGSDGQTTKTVIQYALGDENGPILDSDYAIGEGDEETGWQLGEESYLVGEESWSYTTPTPALGQYVWMRIGTYNPSIENWPAPTSWQYTRLTGRDSRTITVVSSADVIPTTSRGIPKIASIRFTALLQNISISLASDITWTCTDLGVTLTHVDGDIYSVDLDTSDVTATSFYVMAEIG